MKHIVTRTAGGGTATTSAWLAYGLPLAIGIGIIIVAVFIIKSAASQE